MIGIIPAAGEGRRLGLPFPKELYPVVDECGISLSIDFTMSQMAAVCNHIVIIINEHKSAIIKHLGDGSRYGCRISYVVQEQPGGLAQALDAAHHLTRNETVIFGMPDTIIEPCGVFREIAKKEMRIADIVMGVFRVDDPGLFGMVELDDESVIRIDDKPVITDLEYAWGIMTWRQSFTKWLHESVSDYGMIDFDEIINCAICAGLDIRAVRLDEYSYQDIGSHGQLLAMQRGGIA